MQASEQFAHANGDEQFRNLFREMLAYEQTNAPVMALAAVTVSSYRSRFSESGGAVSFSSRKPGSLSMLRGSVPLRASGRGATVTSGFGMREHPILGGLRAHRGVDLAAPMGSPILATSDGNVSMADWSGGYGLTVQLDHGGGLQTRYGHMSRLNVAPGQRVRKGDVIGYVGSTGLSTGPHLHYEVRVNGEAVNPVPLLKAK